MHAPSGLGGAVLGALVSLGGYVFFAVQAARDGAYADGYGQHSRKRPRTFCWPGASSRDSGSRAVSLALGWQPTR